MIMIYVGVDDGVWIFGDFCFCCDSGLPALRRVIILVS
jgi:hypothetical protein